ncbi:Molybdopterin oxidoreductase [Planctomycetales bacterium 10988]|nr:Molybdopterin oxidoreductase [Planctomycetales bacterium 10988]
MSPEEASKSIPAGAVPPAGVDAQKKKKLGIFESYQVGTGGYDEMFSAPGVVRPAYLPFFSNVEKLGSDRLRARWERAQHNLRDIGVTYTIYNDRQENNRPWELDPIPLILHENEWRHLEKGIQQRAFLLNALLHDLYGTQRILQQALLPPELIYAHPNFLRACHNIRIPDDRPLQIYSVDLARNHQGQWTVFSDRTQAPSGAGYALENRTIVSDILSEAFQECKVERLAAYFRRLKETLFHLARRHQENPRVVLLSSGPHNETYFEHFYLARYLGFTLSQGADLTVRDGQIFLKTLEGLLPVDVILRRQDDDYCDPLELNRYSVLGVAGLTQAVREGNVSIANALGSGWCESPAVLAFLPAISRAFLGEELILPSVPTWWLGDKKALQHVLSDFGRYVIKPSFPHFQRQNFFVSQLDLKDRERLIQRIKANPASYVAQEQLPLSTMPIWNSGTPVPRRICFRAYATGTQQREGESANSTGYDQYFVLRGGLTRVTNGADSLVSSMQQGGGSKDTWITSERPRPHISLLPPNKHDLPLRRSGMALSSRVADNMFWLGRYIERVGGLTRTLRYLAMRFSSEDNINLAPEIRPILYHLRELGYLPSYVRHPNHNELPMPAQCERELLQIVHGNEQGHLRRTLQLAQQIASQVRDTVSIDAWRIAYRLTSDIPAQPTGPHYRFVDTVDILNNLIFTIAAFSGTSTESMTRGPGWVFLDIGVRLERALHTSRLLANCIGGKTLQEEGPLLEALLEIADSRMTYRSRYLNAMRLVPAIDLLVTDESNPRSIAFQLVELNSHVARLPRERNLPRLAPEERITLDLQTRFRLADVATLCELNTSQRSTITPISGQRARLAEFLDDIPKKMAELSDILSQRYFNHAISTRHDSL